MSQPNIIFSTLEIQEMEHLATSFGDCWIVLLKQMNSGTPFVQTECHNYSVNTIAR